MLQDHVKVTDTNLTNGGQMEAVIVNILSQHVMMKVRFRTTMEQYQGIQNVDVTILITTHLSVVQEINVHVILQRKIVRAT